MALVFSNIKAGPGVDWGSLEYWRSLKLFSVLRLWDSVLFSYSLYF